MLGAFSCAVGAGELESFGWLQRVMNELEDEGPIVWELRCGENAIATVTVTGEDFPWKYGTFECAAAFEPIRHLFIVHPDRWSSELARTELARLGIRLFTPTGRPVKDFTLQVDGNEAGFQFNGT